VDCDPDSNLAAALGFKSSGAITPISGMKDLIYERMEIKDNNPLLYKLNPGIDDIPDAYVRKMGNINILVMGTVNKGGQGCVCPESVFLKNLLGRIMLREDEHVVLDMEAGIEHLGRRTAESCDHFLVVVEPSTNSVETALKIKKLAADLGVKEVCGVANKIRSRQDIDFIKKGLGSLNIVASIPFLDQLLALDKGGSIGQIKDRPRLVQHLYECNDYGQKTGDR
jgi:CO dehydrogenase maturation factor